jgi:hypothetical protein
MALHPDGDRIFLYSASTSDEIANLVDIYSIKANTIYSFINENDIISPGTFYPVQVDFTPDGKQAILLLYYPLTESSLIGIDILTHTVTFQVNEPLAAAERIAVRPVNLSE